MITIQDLIQETEKEYNLIKDEGKTPDNPAVMKLESDVVKAKLETLKQCQTIAEEREKEIIEIINKMPVTINKDYKDAKEEWMIDSMELKQQLNPAQTKE
jgi:hypothetical protein